MTQGSVREILRVTLERLGSKLETSERSDWLMQDSRHRPMQCLSNGSDDERGHHRVWDVRGCLAVEEPGFETGVVDADCLECRAFLTSTEGYGRQLSWRLKALCTRTWCG